MQHIKCHTNSHAVRKKGLTTYIIKTCHQKRSKSSPDKKHTSGLRYTQTLQVVG